MEPSICISAILLKGCSGGHPSLRLKIVMVCSLLAFIPVTIMQLFLSPIKSWLKMVIVSLWVAVTGAFHMRLYPPVLIS
jgi:hypothetical protein